MRTSVKPTSETHLKQMFHLMNTGIRKVKPYASNMPTSTGMGMRPASRLRPPLSSSKLVARLFVTRVPCGDLCLAGKRQCQQYDDGGATCGPQRLHAQRVACEMPYGSDDASQQHGPKRSRTGHARPHHGYQQHDSHNRAYLKRSVQLTQDG